MKGRVVAFVVLFGVLVGAYESARGTWLERWVIDDVTVRTAAALIGALDPGAGVRAEGPRLVAAGGGLNVLPGCEGVDALLLLVAALVVAPLGARARIGGLLAGTVTVVAANQARLVALFYANRADRELFAALHGVVTPMLMVVAVGAFFFVWLGRFGEPGRSGTTA